jgi:hypothetical protein
MIAYVAQHSCGTEVTDELPDDYPVGEGVGLWCPHCQESFWHTGGEPDEAPVRRRRWSRA